jgi:hypothetical protein
MFRIGTPSRSNVSILPRCDAVEIREEARIDAFPDGSIFDVHFLACPTFSLEAHSFEGLG